MSRTHAGHDFVDHTSEMTLRLRAPSFAALVEEATTAFGELVPEAARGAKSDEWRDFRVTGADPTARLVEWLNELVYLSDVGAWLPTEVEVEGDETAGLRLRARGVELSRPFVLVKAATLHRAFVRDAPGGLEAEVTLDV